MMTDVKRSYPFSLEFSQAPALNYIMPPYAEISTNPRTSCESESGFHFDAANSTSRLFFSYNSVCLVSHLN